jgi:uncharacterized protein (TIGR02996 family)
MTEEDAFLDAIRSKPDDDVTRLVYADWLDEQGGSRNLAKSAFLRLECEFGKLSDDAENHQETEKQLHEMAKTLAAEWLGVVSKMVIEKCELKFAFECPKQWDQLKPTDKDGVRYCEMCQKNVYFCKTVRDARNHAWEGHCVAVQLGLPRSEGDLEMRGVVVGALPILEPSPLPTQKRGQ